MDVPDNEHEALERILVDANAEPTMLSYAFLKDITNNFSEVIGSGGFGVVYKGVVCNRIVAVKKLSNPYGFSDKQFEDELTCLIRVRHKNIVRFLGYCFDTRRKILLHNGRYVVGDIQQRFLCLEYLPNKSIYDYLKDESRKPEWDTCYQMIHGICEGLWYLHNVERINHLDLKPENILLDGEMIPKITDFGLSRRFSEDYSRIITENIAGSRGYIAPEYLKKGEISFKTDMFSLGIIIKQLLIRGCNDSSDLEQHISSEMHSDGRVEAVAVPKNHEWHRSINIDNPQVETCITIAQLCMEIDQHKRPTIDTVLRMLTRKYPLADLKVGADKSSELLDIYPQVLRFSYKPNKRMECPVSLTNPTDHYIGVWITTTEPDSCCCFLLPRKPLFQVMVPHSSWVHNITMKVRQLQPGQRERDMGTTFKVWMIVTGSVQHIRNLKSSIGIELSRNSEFLTRVKNMGCQVQSAMLTSSVIREPASFQATETHHILSTGEFGSVVSVDVHPTEPWILTSHHRIMTSYKAVGYICMWNYNTQERKVVMVQQQVRSAKFIAQEEWFATGDASGHIRVYESKSMDVVKEFNAYLGNPVTLLVVHPTHPFLLSASDCDRTIKLWGWEQGWLCTRMYKVLTDGVLGLMLNPRDVNTFASVDTDRTAKIWEIHSTNALTTFRWKGADSTGCLFTASNRYYLVTCGYKIKNNCAYIWDLQTNECIHTLGVRDMIVSRVACHPTLPILATRLENGNICLWDATNYRFEKMLHLTDFPAQHMVFTGTNDSTRLVLGCMDEIAIMGINLPLVYGFCYAPKCTLCLEDKIHGKSYEFIKAKNNL